MRFLLIVMFLLGAKSLIGQNDSIDFSLLSQNDKANPKERNSIYLKLKSLPFKNPNHFLGFGGGYRFQSEAFLNEQFDQDLDQTDIWFLNRVMLYSSYRYKRFIRLFIEANSSTVFSKQLPTPVDYDTLSINQFFTAFYVKRWEISLGRQNMRLGSGRLIDVREGPNVRLSFDQLSVKYCADKFGIHGFYAIPVNQQPGVFDNIYLSTAEYLTGAYATFTKWPKAGIDVYGLFKYEANKTWNVGQGDDSRVSIGARFFGERSSWTYDAEALYQVGSFDSKSIQAYTASLKLFKTWALGKHPLETGFKTELISGDQSDSDNVLNTFDALYPRGAYFGRVARFGPSNLIDVHPWVGLEVGDWDFSVDYVAFWRFSVNDGLYNPALILDYPSLNEERFIGHQFGTISGFQVSKHLFAELETNIILPGAFLTDSGLDDLLGHAVITVEVRF